MAKGNEIIVTAEPKGVFKEGIIHGTPKPGTLMQVRNTATIGGRHTWEPYAPGSDGDRALIAVLLPDHLQGKTATDAYTTGTRGFVYCPALGEELNMLCTAPGTGTGDSVAIGQKFIGKNATGLLIKTTGTPEQEPFEALEAIDDLVEAGNLVHVQFIG